MEMTMKRSDSPGADIAFLLDDTVNAYRNRGYTRTDAIEQTALALGLSSRKAKAILWREPFALTREELASIHHRFLTHLDDQMSHHEAQKEKLRLRLRQMKLGGL
jgi:hypothetical protein